MRVPAVMWVAGATALLLCVGLASAAFGPRDPECEWPEQLRQGEMRGVPARSHVEDDRAAATLLAEAFGRAVAKRPLLSGSIDAQAGALTAPARAQAWCRAKLESEIAILHGLPIDEVRRGSGEDESGPVVDHAEADRASAAASDSSVVSRPSR